MGQPLKVRIPYTGTMPTDIKLIKDGKTVIIPNDHLNYEVTPDEVIISAPACLKDDAGVYDVTIKNEKGSANLPVKINVKGPPDAPEGPLDVSNVTANSCILKWNEPKVSYTFATTATTCKFE